MHFYLLENSKRRKLSIGVGAFGAIKTFCHLHVPKGGTTLIQDPSIRKLPSDNLKFRFHYSIGNFFLCSTRKGGAATDTPQTLKIWKIAKKVDNKMQNCT